MCHFRFPDGLQLDPASHWSAEARRHTRREGRQGEDDEERESLERRSWCEGKPSILEPIPGVSQRIDVQRVQEIMGVLRESFTSEHLRHKEIIYLRGRREVCSPCLVEVYLYQPSGNGGAEKVGELPADV